MAGAAVFVMPSRLEPFGIVVLEAWRAGTAVVATSRGGPPEFVRDGEDGLLVDPFDTAAFAGALEGLLADPTAGGLSPRPVAPGLRVRVADVAERYRQVYASVTSQARPRRPERSDRPVPHKREPVG